MMHMHNHANKRNNLSGDTLLGSTGSACTFLFLNPNNLSVRLNANHASSLIVDYKSADPGAHFSTRDIRSFSSSLAWLRGATFNNLMSSCHWASGRSFINTYFNSEIYSDARLNALNIGPSGP